MAIPADPGRYSPAQIQGAKVWCCSGRPDPKHISTSFVERQNLTMRMSMKRFARLSNGVSKKAENHAHSVAIHFMHYNFVRQALTDAETGGMIAAPTTSLPEVPGGDKNWDYRYTWLRDSTFALSAFLNAGYHEEARAWRDWLLRAAAGVPERLQTMFRVDGSRHIGHRDVPWLPGYEDAGPVRVGNPAADQFQLDIYGEILDSLHLCQQSGMNDLTSEMAIEAAIVAHLEKVWVRPDEGIWESRGPAQQNGYWPCAMMSACCPKSGMSGKAHQRSTGALTKNQD